MKLLMEVVRSSNHTIEGSGKKRLCCPGVDYKRRLPGGTSKQTRGGTWVGGPGPDTEKRCIMTQMPGEREEHLFFAVKVGGRRPSHCGDHSGSRGLLPFCTSADSVSFCQDGSGGLQALPA